MSIPKVIHYCWFGGAEKPKSVNRCIESWKKHCPDYEIREWSEKEFDVTQNKYCLQAYEAKAWGFVPDYIRLWIIYNNGGIYLDTDVQVIKSFDTLLANKAFAGFERGTEDDKRGFYVNFGQGFGAEPRNNIIKEHLELYNDIDYRLPDGSYNRTPSPQYTTKVLEDHGLDRKKNTTQNLDEITIYSDDFFCPKSFATGLIKKTNNTYSIHQFDGSWYSDDEQNQKTKFWRSAKRDYIIHLPNRILKKILGDSLYEDLKRMFGK